MNSDKLNPTGIPFSASVRSVPDHSQNAKTRLSLSWPSLYMFAFGFGWAVSLELQFRVYLAELIMLTLLPFLRWRLIFGKYQALSRVLVCLALWLVAILFSDLFNQNDPMNTLRALSTPVLATLTLVFVLACVHHAPRSLLAFFCGMALGKLLFGEPFYGPEWAARSIDLSALFELNYFKARIEPFLTPVLLVGLAWLGRNRPRRVVLPAMVIGATYILLDSRSSGLFFLISSLMFLLINMGRRISPATVVGGGVLMCGVLYALFVLYVDHTLRNNVTSQTGRQLAQVENPYNPIELLRVGRPEWTVMPSAIAERPVMGWGSWAEDTRNRFNFMQAQSAGLIYEGVEQFAGTTYIPAHSTIGAAWMWSGLLGLVAMISLGIVLVQLGVAASSHRTVMLFIALFLSAHMAWAFFFSPPQSVRTQFPIAMAMLIYLGSASSGRLTRSVAETSLARMRP